MKRSADEMVCYRIRHDFEALTTWWPWAREAMIEQNPELPHPPTKPLPQGKVIYAALAKIHGYGADVIRNIVERRGAYKDDV